MLINTKHPAVNTVEHTVPAIAQKAFIGEQGKSVRKTCFMFFSVIPFLFLNNFMMSVFVKFRGEKPSTVSKPTEKN